MDEDERVDPRVAPRAVTEVPALLADGQRRYARAEYWEAHEAWESAWHALRHAGRRPEAEFLQGLILVAAALENLRRGKPEGFRRQMAQGLHQLRVHLPAGTALGLDGPAEYLDAITGLYLDVARRLRPAWDHVGQVPAPRLRGSP